MSEDINYTKLINLIQQKKYQSALIEVKQLLIPAPESIQLILLKLYCQIEAGKMRSAVIELNKALKKFPGHHLLQMTKEHIETIKSGGKSKNPLIQFVETFAEYFSTSFTDEDQFNKLMNQILLKPYIK